jgi:hypothetical protein
VQARDGDDIPVETARVDAAAELALRVAQRRALGRLGQQDVHATGARARAGRSRGQRAKVGLQLGQPGEAIVVRIDIDGEDAAPGQKADVR